MRDWYSRKKLKQHTEKVSSVIRVLLSRTSLLTPMVRKTILAVALLSIIFFLNVIDFEFPSPPWYLLLLLPLAFVIAVVPSPLLIFTKKEGRHLGTGNGYWKPVFFAFMALVAIALIYGFLTHATGGLATILERVTESTPMVKEHVPENTVSFIEQYMWELICIAGVALLVIFVWQSQVGLNLLANTAPLLLLVSLILGMWLLNPAMWGKFTADTGLVVMSIVWILVIFLLWYKPGFVRRLAAVVLAFFVFTWLNKHLEFVPQMSRSVAVASKTAKPNATPKQHFVVCFGPLGGQGVTDYENLPRIPSVNCACGVGHEFGEISFSWRNQGRGWCPLKQHSVYANSEDRWLVVGSLEFSSECRESNTCVGNWQAENGHGVHARGTFITVRKWHGPYRGVRSRLVSGIMEHGRLEVKPLN